MSLSAILGIVAGIVRFFPLVADFVRLLQKTPAEKHAAILSSVLDASRKADQTKGDTSGYENLLKGR